MRFKIGIDRTIWWDFYHWEVRKHTNFMAGILHDVVGQIDDLYDLNKFDLPHVNLTHFQDPGDMGEYIGFFNEINISTSTSYPFYDLRKPVRIIETFLHELTHAEQYYQHRLWGFIGYKTTWHGRLYDCHDISHEEYLNLPWEIEARDKAEKLLPVVMKRINFYDKYLD